jgi:hypothetical protein
MADLPLRVRDQDGPPYTDILDAGGRLLLTVYPARGADPLRNIAAAEKEAREFVKRVNLYDDLIRLLQEAHASREGWDHPWMDRVAFVLAKVDA